MRLAVLIDVIAIASRIAVILVAADDSADNPAEDCSGDRSRCSSEAWKDGTCKSTRTGAERRSSRGTCNFMIISGSCCTAAECKTARSSRRNKQTFHVIVLPKAAPSPLHCPDRNFVPPLAGSVPRTVAKTE
jgi:hypothetical protein